MSQPLPNDPGEWGTDDLKESDDLKERQLRAIELELQGGSYVQIAREVGVSRQALWRWQKQPTYRAVRARLRSTDRQRRSDRFWALVDRALDVAEESILEGYSADG